MFIRRVTSPHMFKHAMAHALLVGVTLAVVPTFAQQEQIDSTKSVITIHVFKSGLFSSFAHDHVIQAPIASGHIDLREESVTLSFNVGDIRVLDPGASVTGTGVWLLGKTLCSTAWRTASAATKVKLANALASGSADAVVDVLSKMGAAQVGH